MKLKDYSIGNVIVFVTRITMIMGLALNIRPLTIVIAVLLGIVATAGMILDLGLSRRSYIISMCAFVVIIMAALSGRMEARVIVSLIPLSDICVIVHAQWKGKYFGNILENLDQGNF